MGTKGEKERGQTARQPQNTQQQEEQRTSGREGKEGRREGRGWPRAWGVEEGIKAAGREQRGIRQTEVKKRGINI